MLAGPAVCQGVIILQAKHTGVNSPASRYPTAFAANERQLTPPERETILENDSKYTFWPSAVKQCQR